MTGAIELQSDNGPKSSLGIGPGSDDVVGPHREFARRFAKGIGKLAGNTQRDRQKKTERLAVRMLKAARLAGPLFSACNNLNPCGNPSQASEPRSPPLIPGNMDSNISSVLRVWLLYGCKQMPRSLHHRGCAASTNHTAASQGKRRWPHLVFMAFSAPCGGAGTVAEPSSCSRRK
ncbi:hypothetical protein GW17_00047701 [Ensete ventricosum]|nr:hypothetical protein GW17_00047701 [Ensete ventricosum]